MQMFSVFDVESITLFPPTSVDPEIPIIKYRIIEVRFKGGLILMKFYSEKPIEIEEVKQSQF